MGAEHGLCHTARFEQAEAQQHRIAHCQPNCAGHVARRGNALDQNRVNAHDHHNQKRLKAQRQQRFQIVLPDIAPFSVCHGSKRDGSQRGHKIYFNHSPVDHQHNADGKNVHGQPDKQGLKPQSNQSAKAHSFQRRLQITHKGIYVNAGIADYHACALIDDLLRRVKNAHDDIPSVRDNQNSRVGFEYPFEEHKGVNVVQIVFLCHHLDQLVGHYKCENCTRNRDDDGFGQVVDHIENAGVPALRRRSDISGDFAHLCIHRIEQPRQVADDSVDQNALKPFLQPINGLIFGIRFSNLLAANSILCCLRTASPQGIAALAAQGGVATLTERSDATFSVKQFSSADGE